MLSASWRSPSLKLGSQLSVCKANAAVVLFRKCQRRDAGKPGDATILHLHSTERSHSSHRPLLQQ